MLRKQINGTTLRGTDGIDRTLNAVTLSEDEKKKVGEIDFLPNDVLLADGVKAVAANDKVGLTEEEISKGLHEGKWIPIQGGITRSGFKNGSIVQNSCKQIAGTNAHAEGTDTAAIGSNSHAEGNQTKAVGQSSHAEGKGTITYSICEHAEGTYNYSEENKFISTIGFGTSDKNRRNAFAVGIDGYIFIYGMGGYSGKSYANTSSLQTLLASLNQRIIDLEDKVAILGAEYNRLYYRVTGEVPEEMEKEID